MNYLLSPSGSLTCQLTFIESDITRYCKRRARRQRGRRFTVPLPKVQYQSKSWVIVKDMSIFIVMNLSSTLKDTAKKDWDEDGSDDSSGLFTKISNELTREKCISNVLYSWDIMPPQRVDIEFFHPSSLRKPKELNYQVSEWNIPVVLTELGLPGHLNFNLKDFYKQYPSLNVKGQRNLFKNFQNELTRLYDMFRGGSNGIGSFRICSSKK